MTTSSHPRVAPLSDDRRSRRVAIVDLGSNTFRLVVFRYSPNGPYAMADEIRETVRLSAGAVDGRITDEAIARGVTAARMYATYCQRSGIDEVVVGATSAIRDATNQREILDAFAQAGLPARVLSTEDEAYYGYLGIVNSMDFTDGFFLDVGGGSAQVGRITRRVLERSMSAPLGAVRMTETFHTGARSKKADIKAQRKHVLGLLAEHPWIANIGQELAGTGGTLRTLTAMTQRKSAYPLSIVHDYALTRDALGSLIEELASLPVADRERIPGLKRERADIILGGAITITTVMDVLGAECIRVCGQGLREGLFNAHRLHRLDPPLVPDVRRSTVLNLVDNFHIDRHHADHVARIATEIYDATAEAGLHPGDALDREWLWAAAMLHDIGVIVNYHDHHKHGWYLVLNSGLPGWDQRELVIIALLVRSHRKSIPNWEEFRPILMDGDDERIRRLIACLRIAEQLERDRTQAVQSVGVSVDGDAATLLLHGDADHAVAMWSASPETAIFERAFGVPMTLEPVRTPASDLPARTGSETS